MPDALALHPGHRSDPLRPDRPPVRRSVLAVAALLLAGVAPSPAWGQAVEGPGAPSPEAVVRGLFDAMRSADSAAARRLLHPDARLHRPVSRGGDRALRTSDVRG